VPEADQTQQTGASRSIPRRRTLRGLQGATLATVLLALVACAPGTTCPGDLPKERLRAVFPLAVGARSYGSSVRGGTLTTLIGDCFRELHLLDNGILEEQMATTVDNKSSLSALAFADARAADSYFQTALKGHRCEGWVSTGNGSPQASQWWAGELPQPSQQIFSYTTVVLHRNVVLRELEVVGAPDPMPVSGDDLTKAAQDRIDQASC
jgi:hypothetical protein